MIRPPQSPPNRSADRKGDVIEVVIVDDHPIARCGVEHVLSGRPYVRVTASVGALDELEGMRIGQPDVVVLDLYLDGDAPSLAAVTALSAWTRVLVMSASALPRDVLGAIRAGAGGYLTKGSSAEVFAQTVETVARGGFAMSSELADVIHSELGGPGIPSARARDKPPEHNAIAAPELSPREEETLGYIARGFTHAQTATKMGISKATVNTYVERIRVKLQVGNKAQLTRAALELHAARAARPE